MDYSLNLDGMEWHINKRGYIVNQQGELQHRYIWEKVNGSIPYGYDLHHKNEKKEDNRIDNLICISHQEHVTHHARNMAVKTKDKIANINHVQGLRRNNTSGFKGVLYAKDSKKWVASIWIRDNKKKECLGYYQTKEQAALAYDKRARELWGEDAFQNFPKVI